MESVSRKVVRYNGATASSIDDAVAVETPIELRLDGVPIAVLMATPTDIGDLALGFTLTEGILLAPEELTGIEPTGNGDRWNLRLAPGVRVDAEQFRRSVYTSSSCGVCGKASIDAVRIAARPLPAGPSVDPARLSRLPRLLAGVQPGFTSTGALHGAAIFDAEGTVLASSEDIGRHNAVDKAIGALATRRWPVGEVILQVSGRISFEIAQKAAVAGIPFVAGVSAASSLAVDLATDLGMTLVGFVRGEGFVVYNDAGRIGPHPPP